MTSRKSPLPDFSLLAAMAVYPRTPNASDDEGAVADMIGALCEKISDYAKTISHEKNRQEIENLAFQLEQIATCFSMAPDVLVATVTDYSEMKEKDVLDCIMAMRDPVFSHPRIFRAYTVLNQAGSEEHRALMTLLNKLAPPSEIDLDLGLGQSVREFPRKAKTSDFQI